MAEQLTFDLPARPALDRADFYAAPANSTALAAIDGWRSWPRGKLALVGDEGAGKTHLAHVFADQSGGRVIGPDALSDPDALANGPLALDDADETDDETAFFHLFNLMDTRGHAFLLTARRPPARWRHALPDLTSRLATIEVAELHPPDDTLLAAVLAKHFTDRQLAPAPDVIPYLVKRMERVLADTGDIVAEIDRLALKEGRNITRSLAAEALDSGQSDKA